MVYDRDRKQCVVFGGYNGSQFMGDTWELGPAPVPAMSISGMVVLAILLASAGAFALRRRPTGVSA